MIVYFTYCLFLIRLRRCHPLPAFNRFFFQGLTGVKENGQWDERGGVRGGVDRGWGKRLSAGSSVSTYFNLEILEESNVARIRSRAHYAEKN